MKKFKKRVLPIALSLSVVGLAGCSAGGGTKYLSSKAGDITDKDIIESLGSSQISKSATSMMIEKILLDKYKGKINEKAIEEQFNKAQEQYGGKEKFEQLLKQQGFTLDKYKDGLKVKEAQALMIKSGTSDEEAKKKADEVLKKIKEGGDFATLAKENSNDTANAAEGGDLGWSSKEDSSFVKEFTDAAFKLGKDQVSDVVKTSFGYHIIKVLDIKEASYEELKPTLERKLADDAVKNDPTIVSKALKKLFDEYNVKSDNGDVEKYVKSVLDGTTESK